MKIELMIDGEREHRDHLEKNIDVTFKIREGKIKKVIKSVGENPKK